MRRRTLGIALLSCALIVSATAVVSYGLMGGAVSSLVQLRAASQEQRQTLHQLDRQAGELDRQLQRLQRENAALRGLMGPPTRAASSHAPRVSQLRADDVPALRRRFARLQALAEIEVREERSLQRLALRVVSARKLEAIGRARLLASIPQLNPVPGAEISAGFGWRTDPWPEYHQGVDLAADYGTSVRAVADGTVVSAGWDGGFGQKIAIDHHNGYESWYAHLSRIDVHVGESIAKGAPIAAVGATGEATGPHLHYQLMRAGQAIDPAPFLAGVPAKVIASLK